MPKNTIMSNMKQKRKSKKEKKNQNPKRDDHKFISPQDRSFIGTHTI